MSPDFLGPLHREDTGLPCYLARHVVECIWASQEGGSVIRLTNDKHIIVREAPQAVMGHTPTPRRKKGV